MSRLENRGWVRRQPSEDDRRTNIASLTDEGRKFLQEAAPGHVERVLELVFDGLSAEENLQLGTLLGKILSHLDPPALPRVTSADEREDEDAEEED
ncbi:MarR family winged helix-turn-helix transcriptional regulator [Corynebacterium yudongzhengii]|uniref:MarR family winged helix-turn-helix transcriptional regulator n=1 Tax=Corynebacterium yudongzhengii TaxID=2080740 RepID=UPI001F323298|nr:winged helix DNA-binding protein [Corynebacterium yudongzhengii]